MRNGTDLRAIQRKCRGQLHPAAYRKLYELAASVRHGTILEIGAGHGASTIVMARALADSGSAARVVSFEKGSHFDGIIRNIEHFGVADRVAMRFEQLDRKQSYPDIGPIAMMFIDADGAIDRDFELFLERVEANAPIVIDDAELPPSPALREGKIRIFMKGPITRHLLREFLKLGVIESVESCHGVTVLRRSAKKADVGEMQRRADRAYRRAARDVTISPGYFFRSLVLNPIFVAIAKILARR